MNRATALVASGVSSFAVFRMTVRLDLRVFDVCNVIEGIYRRDLFNDR